MMSRSMFVGLAAALCLAACASTPTPRAHQNITQIVSTTSFGMCVGYCTTRLEISQGRAVLIREARGGRGAPQNLPEQRFATVLTPEEWDAFENLASNTDLSGLAPVIGCPDCADGGAESLSITGEGAARAISFEYGASIPEAAPLLERIRSLRARLTPAD